MVGVSKGSKTDLTDDRYTVRIATPGPSGTVDIAAVLLTSHGKVRDDDDFIFFNNPKASGVTLLSEETIAIALHALPAEIDRVVVTASTEAQGKQFCDVPTLAVDIRGTDQALTFTPEGLTSETVLQVVALYRRGSAWRLDAIGQGYSRGLAAFATEHGIDVESPNTSPPSIEALDTTAAAAAPPSENPAITAAKGVFAAAKDAFVAAKAAVATPTAPATPAPHPHPDAAPGISFEKVKVTLTKDSPNQTARIDLRKSQGDPKWVLTVGLEWDGRGATYDRKGNVAKYGTGDLDVYFFCRNEETNGYVIISGDKGHQGDLKKWPFIHHHGDSKGPGKGNKPAVEQVRVLPNENGDLLVNIYQSVDNGIGALDKFGRPRVAIRYGRAGRSGLPGPDADEILVYVGNSKNSFWATVAHIDVQDGVLTVDGETRYSRVGTERMPGLDSTGKWVRTPADGPKGRSKKRNGGRGLDKYSGQCPK
ncbi:TerD family protein [Rhodococcus sp. LB1]|uniref:TerD family protein n=1 Tax=Rhodococcus sp. LB1 TaxID=1807499 RepID=UPI00077A9CF7|nr:TerD family protein [Rhodococcus sp. LB1]KXX62831.1 stress protein [Rhodococcus sp. LB1]